MTVRSRNVKRNERIKRMLLDCYPITTIAKFTKLSPTRVRQIKDMLLADGELMAVPHTKPTLYIDPHAHALESEFSDNGGGAESDGPRYIQDSIPDCGRLPMGMVNAHISGRISMTVREKGSFDDIRGPNGLYVGYWDKPTSGGKGKIHRKAHLRLFKQELTINYYESGKGTMEFYVNPGRVYYYPNKVKRNLVIDYIMERVLFVADLLKDNGWQVTDPQLPKKYQLHRGKEGDPLSTLIPPRYHDEGQSITSDTSPDYLETEMEDVTDEELIEIYADMPSAIQDVKKQVASGSIDIESMKAEILGLKEVVEIQGEVIRGLAGNVTGLTEIATRFTNMETWALSKRFSDFTGEGYH